MNTLSVKLRNFYGSVKKHPDHIIYICIALTVVVFNLIAIFGIDALFSDDCVSYNLVLEGKFPQGLMIYSPIYAYKGWITFNIMAYSPYLTRGLHLLFFMIPLSFCFYYLYRFKFGFSRLSAFTAAILPNILPYQWKIPAGNIASYPLWILLFSVFSLILGLHYLEKTTSKNWIRLLGAIMCYLIATQLGGGHSVFLFPPLVLVFLGYTKFNKKHIWLISFIFIVAMAKFIWMIAVPRIPIKDLPTGEILRRIGHYFKWSLPSPNIEPIYLTIICVVIILIGFILYIKGPESRLTLINKNFFHMKKKVYVLYFYAFFICWSVSTIFVIIFMNRGFGARHAVISAFGLNAIFIFSIYVILNRGFFKKYKLYIFVFIGIIIFSGISRYINLKKIFDFKNSNQSVIIRDLNKQTLPLNSQVVISGVRGTSPGWPGSSGYLKFALKRKDINGLTGSINASPYYNFDNHFNPGERRWGFRNSMTGLSIDRPTFLFLMLKKQKKLKQFEYALQWKGKTKNAPWTILKANKKSGDISPFIPGIGMKEYLLTLKKLEKKGISQSEILWGGPPTKKELKRLKKLELDPKLFQVGFLFNQFNKIESSRAKQFLSISNTIDTIAKNIDFENRFQLLSSFSDQVTDEDGRVNKIIHILWKSMVKQRINKHTLAIILLKNRKKIWGKQLRFCNPGLRLKPGDYIFGSVKIPADKFKQAENLGIRLFVAPGPKKWNGLKIQGNHKTDQGSFRLLIPIK